MRSLGVYIDECACKPGQDAVETIFGLHNPVGTALGLNFELGTQFVSSQTGYVTALRFFRRILDQSSTATPRNLTLWDNLGNILARTTIIPVTIGWQLAPIAPVMIVAGTPYVVSYSNVHNTLNQIFLYGTNDLPQVGDPDGILTGLQ